MIETLTAWLAVWGLALIAVFNGVGRCGIPLPSSILMVLAGALIVDTQAELMVAVVIAYLSTLAGDVVAYRIGQAGGPWLTRLSERSAQAATLLTRAQNLAERHGALAVLVTRWPLSTLGPYLNLVAGAIGLNWRHFLAFCLVGELFWVSLYLSLGYFARSQLTETIEGANRTTVIGGVIVLAAFLVLWLASRLRQRR